MLGLLGTFTTLLYNNITKQLDELQKQIEKLDGENDEEREKDRGRFDQVDKHLDQNVKDTDGRFDKIEDRLTRMEMAMVDASTSGSQQVKRKRRRRGIRERSRKPRHRPLQDAYEPERYAEKTMEEARGVGVARVLGEAPDSSRSEGVRQLTRSERRLRRKCRRPKNFTSEECQPLQPPAANLAEASDRLAKLQNFEADVRH